MKKELEPPKNKSHDHFLNNHGLVCGIIEDCTAEMDCGIGQKINGQQLVSDDHDAKGFDLPCCAAPFITGLPGVLL